jgi:hypothetical protein
MSPGSAVYEPLDAAATGRLLAAWQDAWGLDPAVLAGWTFWQRPDSGAVSMIPIGWTPEPDLPLEALGMLVLRRPLPLSSVSTAFLRRFGRHFTRNVVGPLWGEALTAFLQGRRQPWAPSSHAGAVLVLDAEGPLGRGIVRHLEDGWWLDSELPRQLRPA